MGRNGLFILKPQNHFIEVLGRSYSTKNGRGGDAFDLCRSVVQAFLRERVGRHHKLWKTATDILPFRKTAKQGNPQEVGQIKTLMNKLPEHHSKVVWTLCTTGMGWSELTGKWEVEKPNIGF